MGSYNYTISIGHLGEQLTLNQWVLGSSPRWCTKECLTRKCRAFFVALFQEGTIWCTIPSGTASCFAYGSHSARGDWSLKSNRPPKPRLAAPPPSMREYSQQENIH